MLHIKTPLFQSTLLSERVGTAVWLKMEALQPCGSFKARGVGFACSRYVLDGAKMLISSSGGNAGLAVAYSGRKLGVPARIIVPEVTPQRAIGLMRAEGAEVVVHGESWFEAHQLASQQAIAEEAAYIHPFDDPLIWQGHASLVDELVEADVRPDGIILSVGGGGLMCGVVQGLLAHDLTIPVLAVETAGANSLETAVSQNQHISLDKITSIANTLGAKQVAARAFELTKQYPIENAVVSDETAVSACTQFLDDHRTLVEPACGASLSVVYDNHAFLRNKKNVVVIVCGGAGITRDSLDQFRQIVADGD